MLGRRLDYLSSGILHRYPVGAQHKVRLASNDFLLLRIIKMAVENLF